MAEVFKSHGKLMITGEYFVLHGAKSLMLPTKFFQDMTVSKLNEDNIILWESYDQNNSKWFSAKFNLPDLAIQGEETKEKIFLKKILDFIAKKNPKSFENNSGINIKTRMDFNRSWGLGTSAILINNLSNILNLLGADDNERIQLVKFFDDKDVSHSLVKNKLKEIRNG